MLTALEEKFRMVRELIASGLKFHKLQGPTTKIEFLGASFDTEAMTVAIPEERIKWMIVYNSKSGEARRATHSKSYLP